MPASRRCRLDDLRDAVTVMVQCNAENTGYPSAVPAAGGTPTGCAGQRIKLSTGTTLAYHPQPATERAAYILSATNRSGSGKTFCYNSASGGAITTTAHALTAWRATC